MKEENPRDWGEWPYPPGKPMPFPPLGPSATGEELLRLLREIYNRLDAIEKRLTEIEKKVGELKSKKG